MSFKAIQQPKNQNFDSGISLTMRTASGKTETARFRDGEGSKLSVWYNQNRPKKAKGK